MAKREKKKPVSSNLNVGCGKNYADGWLNVDTDERVSPDLVASALDLPVDDGSVDKIYVSHLLERLTVSEVTTALQEFRRVLKDDGTLIVVGPDRDLMRKFMTNPGEFDLAVRDNTRWLPDQHRWNSTEFSTATALALEGWESEATSAMDLSDDWPQPSKIDWQFILTAHKASTGPKTDDKAAGLEDVHQALTSLLEDRTAE